MIYFHSVAKKSVVQRLVKGKKPVTEMYGIFKPEYSKDGYVNLNAMNIFLDNKGNIKYNKIIFAGEAEDYCVYETFVQAFDMHKNNQELLKRFYILRDCMSAIGERDKVDKMYDDLQKKYSFHMVNSTDDFLS